MRIVVKILKYAAFAICIILVLGLFIPEKITIPVQGASSNDWNHDTFWYDPWGTSGVHKEFDIFGIKSTHVVAATSGIVVFAGKFGKGGNVVAVLGPKWRVHYFAHLDSYSVSSGYFVKMNSKIGELGDTGNATGKQPHVHYSIFSLVPVPWLATLERQGWKKMFFLNPHEKLQ
jgi:murein DD-endopeptidase MepM/ murein hydrolase activator NlpD